MRRGMVWALESLCAVADSAPTWERIDGKWHHIKGAWGCRLGLSRWAAELDERWGTGVWSEECNHEWTQRDQGSGFRWRECWLCGQQSDYE